jgi:hypothetical protein
MAAPTYVDKSAFASGVAGLTVGAVPNVVADDLILLFIESSNQAATMSSPWIQAPSSPQGNGIAGNAGAIRLTVYYQFATGADTTTSVPDSGDHTAAIKMAFRGVNTDNPFNANAGTASLTSPFPAVTTTVTDCLIVLSIATTRDVNSTNEIAIGTNANLSSITERHDESTNAGGGGGIAVFTGVKSTAGSTGTTPYSYVVATTASSGIVLALAPPIIGVFAAPGTYSYTGTAANTLFKRKVVAQASTYSYTGVAANFRIGKILQVDSGSYSYTGTAANTLFNRKVVAEATTYSYTGTDATLTYTQQTAYNLTVDSGTYSYSGTDADILHSRVLTLDSGTYSYTGTDATLTYAQLNAYTLATDSGTYSYTGTDATLIYTQMGVYILIADPGTYSYTGTAADALFNRKVVADPGAYSYTGTAADTLFNRKVVADLGTYSYAGTAADILSKRKVVADLGTYSYAGTAANILFNRKIVAASGTYSYSGVDAVLVYTPAGFNIYLGASQVNKIYLGTNDISKVFLGTTGL